MKIFICVFHVVYGTHIYATIADSVEDAAEKFISNYISGYNVPTMIDEWRRINNGYWVYGSYSLGVDELTFSEEDDGCHYLGGYAE